MSSGVEHSVKTGKEKGRVSADLCMCQQTSCSCKAEKNPANHWLTAGVECFYTQVTVSMQEERKTRQDNAREGQAGFGRSREEKEPERLGSERGMAPQSQTTCRQR